MITKFSTKEKLILIAIILLACLALHFVQHQEHEVKASGVESQYFKAEDLAVIRTAAIRNGIKPDTDDWYYLLAIRISENGQAGNEFGIQNPKANDLDSQAGWCAATIMKNRARYAAIPYKTDNHSFVEFLGSRYCPTTGKGLSDTERRLNINWIPNVRYWSKRLRGE